MRTFKISLTHLNKAFPVSMDALLSHLERMKNEINFNKSKIIFGNVKIAKEYFANKNNDDRNVYLDGSLITCTNIDYSGTEIEENDVPSVVDFDIQFQCSAYEKIFDEIEKCGENIQNYYILRPNGFGQDVYGYENIRAKYSSIISFHLIVFDSKEDKIKYLEERPELPLIESYVY